MAASTGEKKTAIDTSGNLERQKMHKTECDKCERKSKCSPFNKSIGLDCKDFKNKSKEKEKKTDGIKN